MTIRSTTIYWWHRVGMQASAYDHPANDDDNESSTQQLIKTYLNPIVINFKKNKAVRFRQL